MFLELMQFSCLLDKAGAPYFGHLGSANPSSASADPVSAIPPIALLSLWIQLPKCPLPLPFPSHLINNPSVFILSLTSFLIPLPFFVPQLYSKQTSIMVLYLLTL